MHRDDDDGGADYDHEMMMIMMMKINSLLSQCLENLPMPTIPYIVGILIQRQEAPWAQLFPIRLMLRLGTMFRCKYTTWYYKTIPTFLHLDVGVDKVDVETYAAIMNYV